MSKHELEKEKPLPLSPHVEEEEVKDKDKKPFRSQLGIKITIDRVESKPLPSLVKDESDKVDFYVLNIEWSQVRFKDLPSDHVDKEQDELRDVTVNYQIMKRFSAFHAFHMANFKHYSEFDELFPSRFHMANLHRDTRVEYRKEALGNYLNALVEATLQPNVLAAFVLFLALHSPASCEVTRMTKYKAESKFANGMSPEPVKRSRSNSVSFFQGKGMPELRGFAIDDMVRIVKEGSSFYGREAKVTDPNWHGLVKVEVTGLIGLKAGAKTYKLSDLELLSRPDEDTGPIMVQDHNVVLDPGILLLPNLRRQLEHAGELIDKGVDTTHKITRLLEENKKLRVELENLNLITREDVKEGKLEKFRDMIAVATKESDRLRNERKALMKELDESKNKNDDMNRTFLEVDQFLSLYSQDTKPPKRNSIFSSSSSKANQPPDQGNLAKDAREILSKTQFGRPNFKKIGEDNSGDSICSYDTNGSGGGMDSSMNLESSPKPSPRPIPPNVNLDVSLQEAIDTMNSRETPAVVLNGLKRLINLSLNSKDHALQFSEMGGISGVSSILKEYDSNSAIQEKALKLLVNLSFVSEEASREMVKQGIVNRVVTSLKLHPLVIGVQVKGLWSLKNLAHHYDGALEVKKCGGIDLATKCIKNMITDGPIVDQGLGILQNIAHHVGPQPINLAWNASGISFADLKRIHASRTHTVDIASYLEQDIFVQ